MVEAVPDTSEDVWIGIDLGTTNTAACFWDNLHKRIVQLSNPDSEAIASTPSFVAFDPKKKDFLLVGTPAKNRSTRDAENTVYEAKRLIGRSFDDPDVQGYLTKWPFRVICEDENIRRPKIVVKNNKQDIQLYPEEISAKVLEKMKKAAEKKT